MGEEVANSVAFIIPSKQVPHLAYFKAFVQQGKGSDRTTKPLKASEVPEQGKGPLADYSIFTILFDEPVAKSSKPVVLEILYILTSVLTPFPKEIAQSDPQLVLFEDSHFIPSVYPIRNQVTTIQLPTPNVISFSEKQPSRHSKNEIKFGPYSNAGFLEASPLKVHFEQIRPLIHAETLIREIEISHWGNVYVTETYFLKNKGAKHKGTFSRFFGSTKLSQFHQTKNYPP